MPRRKRDVDDEDVTVKDARISLILGLGVGLLLKLAFFTTLLTWPAYAADLAFTCSGEFKPIDEKVASRNISNETLFINFESKTVWGVLGPYDIDEISDNLIKFSIGTRDQGAYSEGVFDRYSGEVQATVYGNPTVSGAYHLTCKPR